MNFAWIELIDIINQHNYSPEASSMSLGLCKIVFTINKNFWLFIVWVSSKIIITSLFNRVYAKFKIVLVAFQAMRNKTFSNSSTLITIVFFEVIVIGFRSIIYFIVSFSHFYLVLMFLIMK